MKFFTTSKISENIRETPEGFLVCLGVSIARTGEMVYGVGECPIEPGPDGRVVITREAAEVFRPETIASFQAKAITILHPDDWVNPRNWMKLANGNVQNVRRGDGEQENDLVADLWITTDKAITLIKNGLREVSCGYEADWLETGVGRGMQKNIIGNHLALVAQGRAGAAYAINDHIGEVKMKVGEKLKAIFARAHDEAAKAVEDDVQPSVASGGAGVVTPTAGYDELIKMVKDLGEKIGAMAPKPADAAAVDPKPIVVPTVDEPAPAVQAPSMEDRMKKVEDALAKLMSVGDEKKDDDKKDADDAAACDEDGDEDEEAEEVEDDGEEVEGEMVGDSADVSDLASRVEILAPGLKATGKDAKVKALTVAYATKDGKSIIEKFTGGKEPNFKDINLVETLFVGTSELLKVKRNSELAGSKKVRDAGTEISVPKSAEELNKMNEKFYSAK